MGKTRPSPRLVKAGVVASQWIRRATNPRYAVALTALCLGQATVMVALTVSAVVPPSTTYWVGMGAFIAVTLVLWGVTAMTILRLAIMGASVDEKEPPTTEGEKSPLVDKGEQPTTTDGKKTPPVDKGEQPTPSGEKTPPVDEEEQPPPSGDE